MPRKQSEFKPDMNALSVVAGDITDNAIESRHIADGEITQRHLANDIIIKASNVSYAQREGDQFFTDPNVQNALSLIWSSGGVFGFELTKNVDSTINIADGDCALRPIDDIRSDLIAYHVLGRNNIELIDETTNYVYLDYNDGSPVIRTTIDITTIPATDKVVIWVVTRFDDVHLHVIDVRAYNVNFMSKYARKIVSQQNVEYGGFGSITSEIGTRNLFVTPGYFYYINERIVHSGFDTSIAGNDLSNVFNYVYRDGAGGWTRVYNQKQISNSLYDDGSGNLATIDNNKYVVSWVFICLNNPSELCVVYPQVQHNTLSAALLEGVPSELPPEVRSYSTGTIIASVITQQNVPNIVEIQNPFELSFSGSMASDHNNLSGLQGGQIGQYYHLTAAQHDILTALRIPISLDAFIEIPTKETELNIHGGINKIISAAPLSSGTPINLSKGTGKLVIGLKAGSDFTGNITITGTSVDRNTGEEVEGDTDILTVDALTIDSTTTDAGGNILHNLTNAYISSKWFKGAIQITTSDLTLTDVDVYHCSFEQFNDVPDIKVETLDINVFVSNSSGTLYAHLYRVSKIPNTNKCDIKELSSVSLASPVANRYYRLRRGNIDYSMNGITDGIFCDVFFGGVVSYFSDFTIKIWASIGLI